MQLAVALYNNHVDDDDERRLQHRQHAIIAQINNPIAIHSNEYEYPNFG